MDNYDVAYNIRRTSTGPAPTSGVQPDRTGANNLQHGQVGTDAAH